jgi:hypothetical protein
VIRLHEQDWDGVWCSILADRFAAGAIPLSPYVAGNPPWVKWSNLPPEYAGFIKDHCIALGVFSTDRWVGGIESDISTVITYEAARSRLAPGGMLGFFITGTVFANESSQGFRRFRIPDTEVTMSVEGVEDFDAVAPFEGVANLPTLLLLRRDGHVSYPVSYIMWKSSDRHFPSAAHFRAAATSEELLAAPVPGSDAGPWLKGSASDHAVWQQIFGADEPAYRARKGVTTDANGIFFVSASPRPVSPGMVLVSNNPDLGRRRGIPRITAPIEEEHLFPLLRGRGIRAFVAETDPDHLILVPQRGMNGEPDLASTAPQTHAFLARFETTLENRSSYRRYQPGQPYWSLWSTGPYTFADHKVVWQEMAGKRFCAARVSRVVHPLLGDRPVVCDHKVYFVPCESAQEADYLCGILNAPTVAGGVSAYAAQLSLGASVVEYLNIPRLVDDDALHLDIAALAGELGTGRRRPDEAALGELDALVKQLLGLA